MAHSREKLNLTGQRYGKLLVLGPAENIGNRTAWRCRCDCGQETVVLTKRLREGHTVSCGCSSPGKGLSALTYVDGTCGVPGVDWLAAKGRWRATICFKGKRRYLGSYTDFEDAVKARKRAEEDIHDRFVEQYDAGS